MKMSVKLYAQLRQDIRDMTQFTHTSGITNPPSMSDMWNLFRHVQRDRMNDDTHPWFVSGAYIRRLPFWSVGGATRDTQGNDHWLNQFYNTEDLNDEHIATALRKIAKELPAMHAQ